MTGPFRVYTIFDGIDGPTPVAEGSYVVGLFADDGGQVNETNETNNQLESADSITVGNHALTFAYSNFRRESLKVWTLPSLQVVYRGGRNRAQSPSRVLAL